MQAKLHALVTLRNTAKSWRRNLQGYSWHTESELKSKLGWEELLALNRFFVCTVRSSRFELAML